VGVERKRGKGEEGKRGRGEKGKRGRGEEEKRRKGEKGMKKTTENICDSRNMGEKILIFHPLSSSPPLLITPSPHHPLSSSPPLKRIKT